MKFKGKTLNNVVIQLRYFNPINSKDYGNEKNTCLLRNVSAEDKSFDGNSLLTWASLSSKAV